MNNYLRQLIEPPVAPGERSTFAKRLLAWFLFIAIAAELLIFVGYVTGTTDDWRRSPVVPVIIATLAAFVIAFGLNRAGRYHLSAALTVSIAAVGTWAVTLSRYQIGGVDQTPLILTFLIISVLMSSVLLPVWATASLALAHLVGIELLRLFGADIIRPTLVTAEIFSGIVFTLVVLLALLRQRDQGQIDQQTTALQESESRFRRLFENSPDAIFLIDPSDDWPIVDCNESACRMNGYTREELIGQPIDILHTQPSDPADRQAYWDQLRRQTVMHHESAHRRKDGRIISIEISTSLVTLGGRQLVLGIDRDISERQRTQQALQESRDNLAHAQAIAGLGSWAWDIATNKITFSDEMYAILGVKQNEFDGRLEQLVARIIHPDDRNRMQHTLQAAREGRREFDPHENPDFRIVWPDGSEHVISTRGDFILDDGKPVGMVGTVQDITERRRVEQEIERRYGELSTLNQIGRALSRLMEADQILELVFEMIGQVLGNSNLYIALYDEAQRQISLPIYTINGIRRGPSSRPSQNGLTEYVLNTLQPLLITHNMTAALEERGISLIGSPSQCYIAVPMLVGEKAIGVIALQDYEREGLYGIEHVNLLTTIASQAAIALDNARLYTTIRRELAEREQLAEAMHTAELRYRTLVEQLPAITYIVEFGEVNRTTYISPQVTTLIGFTPMEWLADPDLWKQQLHSADREYVLAEVRRSDERGESLTMEYRMLTRDGRIVWVRNESTTVPDEWGRPQYAHGVMFDITDRKLAEEALQQTNARLQEGLNELELRNREIALLNEMGDLLQACPTAEEAYSVITNIGRQLFPDDAGAVYIISPSRDTVEAVSVWGANDAGELGERVFLPDDCWALRRSRLHVIVDNDSALFCRHLQPAQPAAYACVPMMAQGEALGILHLQYHPVPLLRETTNAAAVYLAKAKQQLAQTVADSIGLALANLRLRETLRNQSIRDPLTSLFNRRYMEASLEREISRAARNKRPVGIIMLDLDDFKSFNDTFGHEAGDAVLRELGRFLQVHIRGGDIACRYGGEEFTLIMPDASLEITCQRAEQLRHDLRHLRLQHRDQALGLITLSAGVAAFPEHGQTAEIILRAADGALYRAKSDGRDRVRVAEKPQP